MFQGRVNDVDTILKQLKIVNREGCKNYLLDNKLVLIYDKAIEKGEKMNLSSILVNERKQRGYTQQKVADDLYITRQTLSNWENGKSSPDIPTLILLSNYYNFSLDIMKGDQKIMKQIEKDYDLINLKKANKKYAVIFPVILALFVGLIAMTPLFEHSPIIMKSITVLSMILICILLYVNYNFSKTANEAYDGMIDAPLWIPKTFGYGLALNPYNKIGNAITIAISIIIGIICVGTVISVLFLT